MDNWDRALEKMEEHVGRKRLKGLYENVKLQHLIYVHEKTENGKIRYEDCDGTYTIQEMTTTEFLDFVKLG